jgi:hypothetical protein
MPPCAGSRAIFVGSTCPLPLRPPGAVIMPWASSAAPRAPDRRNEALGDASYVRCLDNCGHFVASERPAAKECGGQVEDSSPVARISD